MPDNREHMGARLPEDVIRVNGYVLSYKPDYPRTNQEGYVSEHRLVMEDYLGGPIPHECQVHHLDRRRANNRIENLVLTPNMGLHIYLHGMLKSPNKQDVVKATESWFKEITEEWRDRYKQGTGAPVQLPAEVTRDDDIEPGDQAAVEIDEGHVAKVLLSVADKKVRARQFMELINRYGEAELFDLLCRSNSLPMGRNIIRLIWSVGSLKVHKAGNWFLSLLDEWASPEVRTALYAQLFIRAYPGLDQDKLVAHVSLESGGKSLAYGIKALGRQCSSKHAIVALRKIKKRTEFGYDEERIFRAIAKSIRYIKYRGGQT